MSYPANMLVIKDGKIVGFNPTDCTPEQIANWAPAIEYGAYKGMPVEQACQLLFKEMIECFESSLAAKKDAGEKNAQLVTTEHAVEVLLGRKKPPLNGYNPPLRIEIPVPS